MMQQFVCMYDTTIVRLRNPRTSTGGGTIFQTKKKKRPQRAVANRIKNKYVQYLPSFLAWLSRRLPLVVALQLADVGWEVEAEKERAARAQGEN